MQCQVQRAFDGPDGRTLLPGEVVDSSDWLWERELIDQRYLVVLGPSVVESESDTTATDDENTGDTTGDISGSDDSGNNSSEQSDEADTKDESADDGSNDADDESSEDESRSDEPEVSEAQDQTPTRRSRRRSSGTAEGQ